MWIHIQNLKPKPKERPRYNSLRKVTYTPQATKDYEESIGWAYKTQDGTKHLGAVALYVNFLFKGKDLLKEHTSKPDVDNLVKALMDGLNGVAWEDDCQVVSIDAHKYWAEFDGIRFKVEGLNEL